MYLYRENSDASVRYRRDIPWVAPGAQLARQARPAHSLSNAGILQDMKLYTDIRYIYIYSASGS